jgi:Zn-dependent protease with chaperone function
MNNQIKTIVLLGALSALVLSLGSLIAPGSLYLFALLALAMNLGAYFFSDRLVLRMHGARFSTHPETRERVERLLARARTGSFAFAGKV